VISKAQKINHEETKKTKKGREKLRALRFFVVEFHRFTASSPAP